MIKNIAIKVIGIRNRFNKNDEVFQYVGVDRYGYTYNFDTSQKISFNSYMHLILIDYDVFEGKIILCKNYSIYPLDAEDGKLTKHGRPFKSDKIK